MKKELLEAKKENLQKAIAELAEVMNLEDGVGCLIVMWDKKEETEEKVSMAIQGAFIGSVHNNAQALLGMAEQQKAVSDTIRLANLRMNPVGQLLEHLMSGGSDCNEGTCAGCGEDGCEHHEEKVEGKDNAE